MFPGSRIDSILRAAVAAAWSLCFSLASGEPDSATGQASHADHWAWKPLKSVEPPALENMEGSPTELDQFIHAALQNEKVRPASPAEPAVLLRRVYLDLIGLPPSPDEQRAFLADPTDEAYARIVDDLLARPQYGERWGRHWLDVVRYAESKGYERDEYKKFVWRYRDYVIDAFNRDMPYNRFITEQLAGDELEDADMQTQIATTFLGLGTFDTIAADGELARYDTLDDIVATTSMAFLGQTVQCARCHDHKFEPISQLDYYRMLAAFESLDVTKKERQIGTEEDIRRHREADEQFHVRELQPRMDAEEKAWLPVLRRLQGEGPPEGKKKRLDDKRLQLAVEGIPLPRDQRSKEQARLLEKDRGRIRSAVKEKAEPSELERLKQLEHELAKAESGRPQPMMGWVYPDRSAKPGATRLRIRGDVHQEGEEVSFGIPAVLDRGDVPAPRPTKKSSGRRRALAEWMTGPGTPLAARVMVNRIWQYHFGRGLAPEANNFGLSGGAPTHPELLDWLAHEFVAGGWKIKPLHRLIVLSRAYRRSSSHPEPDSDPGNRLYSRWPVHRLEAEAIRDSVLAASGKLSLKMKGPSIYPAFERQVVGASSKSDWGKSSEEEASRRSVYVFAKRALPLPELAVLGSPDSSCSCEKRNVSTTAVQSLLMMNGKFMNEQAAHLAMSLRKNNVSAEPEDRDLVRQAFQRVLCREPRDEELAQSLEFLKHSLSEDASQDQVGQRKNQPAAADPLAMLCLVLLNTNEFVYRN